MRKKILMTCAAFGLCVVSMTFYCGAFDSIQVGDKGDDVKVIQEALISLGYLTGSADGVFGNGTEAAVSTFQAENGLDATGVVGEATYNKLVEMTGGETADNTTSEEGNAESEAVVSDDLYENVITGATFTDDDFTYEELENGGLRIVEYHGTEEAVTIPSSADGKDVIELGNGVFKDNSTIKSFLIWADLEKIGNGAFMGCTELDTISISSSVESLGVSCFEGCSSLDDVIMWCDLETIPDKCFKDCIALDSISISSDNKYIGESAFENCSDLEDVILWGGDSIGAYAFKNCIKLDSINIDSDITYIGAGAFEGCSDLEDVYIWNDDIEIVENAFEGCPFQPEGYTMVPVPEETQVTDTEAQKETSTSDAVDSSETEVSTEGGGNSSTGISDEFKEAMDSYEEFFDEYVAFMESYDANDVTMLVDYLSFLSQYEDTMNKLDAIDESELTDEEDAYYLEVMLRISEKLVSVAYN